MHDERLDDQSFLLYAAKYYNNPGCYDIEEFYDDLNRFKYIRRLLNKYKETGEVKERLVLNHLVILFNVFGVPAATRMLFYRLDGLESYLKTFLVFLNYMPRQVENIGPLGKTIKDDDIDMDDGIWNKLEEI